VFGRTATDTSDSVVKNGDAQGFWITAAAHPSNPLHSRRIVDVVRSGCQCVGRVSRQAEKPCSAVGLDAVGRVGVKPSAQLGSKTLEDEHLQVSSASKHLCHIINIDAVMAAPPLSAPGG